MTGATPAPATAGDRTTCTDCARPPSYHTCRSCGTSTGSHYAHYCPTHRRRRTYPTTRALGPDGQFPYRCTLPYRHHGPHHLSGDQA